MQGDSEEISAKLEEFMDHRMRIYEKVTSYLDLDKSYSHEWGGQGLLNNVSWHDKPTAG